MSDPLPTGNKLEGYAIYQKQKQGGKCNLSDAGKEEAGSKCHVPMSTRY